MAEESKGPEEKAAKPPEAAEGAAVKPAPRPAEKPAAASPPAKPKGPEATDAMGKPLVANLAMAVPGGILSAKEFVGETTVDVALEKIVDTCRYLKEKESFTYLVDLTSIDWKDRQPRFDVVYWLHSFDRKNERIRLKVAVADGVLCPSVSGVFETANWMEREVFDLMGVRFSGHPDLRRILTWDGFQGHPLRKDFPVEGIDTGAAIYPDRYPEGGGPSPKDPNRKAVS